MRATVMFNGSLYHGDVIRTTNARMLVRFTTGTGRTRDGWFSKASPPAPGTTLVGRRDPRMGKDGYDTLPANGGFIIEGS